LSSKKSDPKIRIRKRTDAKKHRIGLKLTALHAKTDLEILDPVLAALAPLIAPPHRFLRSFRAIRSPSSNNFP
jgi:hypothetical protein